MLSALFLFLQTYLHRCIMLNKGPYYCRSCGYYAYYQLPRHAVCPKCETAMQLMDIRYQDFMDLDYEERDRLICQEIIRSSSTLVQRICAPSKLYNQRELTARLTKEVLRLEAENKKLEETVEWMHQTIWEQLRKTKELERELEQLRGTDARE